MSASAFAPATWLFCAAWCFAAESPDRPVDPAKGLWLKVASANFEVYTTAGEEAGRNLIRRFERLRTVLRPAMGWTGSRERPVCIIAFQSNDEFRPYTPVGQASGFFLPGARRDFVVLESPTTRTRTAAHEYGHVVIAQSGLQLPVWLTEGIAELYSNIEAGPTDSSVVVGQFILGRVFSLRRDGWIDLNELVSASAHSPEFTSPAFVESAYAESWLLAHMLTMDPRYAGGFQTFLSAIQICGTAEAFERAYGKSMPQVERDLRGYLDAGQANARVQSGAPPETIQSIDVQPDADFEARLALAEMLGSYRGRSEQARQVYLQMARDYPLRPEVENGMAEMYRCEGDTVQASEHRARAAVLQTTTVRDLLPR
jgi:hypothetical protein